MDSCMITFRSVTPAQRGELVLRRDGIAASVQRTPRSLAEQGCGYSLRVSCTQLTKAIRLLQQKGIVYRKVYRLGDASPEEVLL
jgi:type III secretory pathway lipoprotein EscJ